MGFHPPPDPYAHRDVRPRPHESLREYIDRVIVGVRSRVGYAEPRPSCPMFLDVAYVWAPCVPVFVAPWRTS